VVTAADDVAAVMEEIGLERAIIVAHSLGGIVALVLNDRHPDRVVGIVTGDSPIGPEFGQSTRLPDMIREVGSMEPAAGFIESFFRDGTPEDVRQRVRETMLSTPSDVGAGMLTLPDDYDFDMLRLINAADEKPFMAIWAADRALGDVDWIRANTVFIRHEPVAGAGHFFQLERPEVTTALLRAFIDDVERDPRIQMAG
jgi:pimeloyl-ACP methyl ester carboxylesterase